MCARIFAATLALAAVGVSCLTGLSGASPETLAQQEKGHAAAVEGTVLVTTHRDDAVADRSDRAFLAAVHRAGITAPDQQAIEVGNEVARLEASGASEETMYRSVRDFGVYDHHVDAFVAAAIAAYMQ
jgi:hypothetical protein